MKYSENTVIAEQPVTMREVESGQMNTADSLSTVSTLELRSEQPAPVIEVERNDLTAFFAVGIVINLVMITAYFVWAYKQWGKTGTSNE